MQLLQNHVVTCSAYLVGSVGNERQEGGKMAGTRQGLYARI